MTADIVLWLAQDGITNGAIYALLALALLLVFSVTRVIFVPQGEFISYAALSLALLQTGKVPGVVYVLVLGGVAAFLFDVVQAMRAGSAPISPACVASQRSAARQSSGAAGNLCSGASR